ncbi:flagellar biosynthetic protein FliR [Endozoicomonas sp. Mp262]|uniref:flagellar biosynthetic protein FliR n=1 Tax=Endozoicomonas sp. Mp262 TaxID=2919499 RepID=UPI0021D7D4B8
MITVTTAEITAWIGQFLWPFFRISSLFMFMPLIGAAAVSPRVRLVLALAIAFLMAPLVPDVPAVEPFSAQALMITLHELAVGFSGALLLHIFMAIFTSAGQVVSTQMGLAMAEMVDPVNGISIPIIGQFYQLASFLLFLAINGHLVVIDLLLASFDFMPVGGVTKLDDMLVELGKLGSWVFSGALLVSLPAVTAMLVVNLTFGVMNRAAPQLNLFSLGFPMAMLCGLLGLMLSFIGASSLFIELTDEVLQLLNMFWRR